MRIYPFQLSISGLFILVSLMVLQACTITPTTVRNSAASLSANELQIDHSYSPTYSVSLAYGITDATDIGIDLENVPAVWVKHSFAPDAQGSQWALHAGVFAASVDTTNDVNGFGGDGSINGFYLGGIYSHKLEGGSSFNLAYRYNALNYDAFSIRTEGGLGLTPNYSFMDTAVGNTVNVSSQDLAGVGTLSATWTIPYKSHAHANVGVLCQIYHTKDNPEIESLACGPMLGMSFFRR